MQPVALNPRQLMRIAESGVVGVVLWDPSGQILDANDRFLALLGFDRAELEDGLDWARITPEKWRARDREAIERLKAEGIARAVEKEYLRKDGESIFVRLHSTVLEDGSGNVISIAVDVTENKRAEVERENAVRSRDDILAIVSHDLRNPLSIISMSVNVLEAKIPDSTRAEQLGIIRRAVTGMNRLIGDLLDVTQAASGKLSIDPQRLDVAEICRDASLVYAPMLASKNQAFECRAPALPLAVRADRDRIAQVLANLIGNAHKFTPEGGRIELAVEALDGFARFLVSDTGPGLSSLDLPYLFDRFWQARRVRRGGVGLGLPITKGIVDAHGGRIWAQSNAGVGTNFYFTLPLATPGDE